MKYNHFNNYFSSIEKSLKMIDLEKVYILASALWDAWQNQKHVFLCGNGGSAANAMHIANDFFYGVAKDTGKGMKAYALSANQSIITCLANDISYNDIFSQQLLVTAQEDDILIALSGSGNSLNIIKAIETAKKMGMKTFAIIGYSGGECLRLADVPIHCPIDDMQIAEDVQLVIGHMVMQWLREKYSLVKTNDEVEI
jgi:D-sedoheptulose 7-phosphate isomerase